MATTPVNRPAPPRSAKEYWTRGAYDTVVALEPPDDETMSAFILKVGSLGNAKDQTVRAFRRNETEGILAKSK